MLACDGLWDVCTHDEVAKLVHEQFEAGKTPQEIASFLCTEALRKRSEDNVTVILTKIDWSGDELKGSCQESTSNQSEKKDEESEMTTEPNTPIIEPTTDIESSTTPSNVQNEDEAKVEGDNK